jgi:hypothetical protein
MRFYAVLYFANYGIGRTFSDLLKIFFENLLNDFFRNCPKSTQKETN